MPSRSLRPMGRLCNIRWALNGHVQSKACTCVHVCGLTMPFPQTRFKIPVLTDTDDISEKATDLIKKCELKIIVYCILHMHACCTTLYTINDTALPCLPQLSPTRATNPIG